MKGILGWTKSVPSRWAVTVVAGIVALAVAAGGAPSTSAIGVTHVGTAKVTASNGKQSRDVGHREQPDNVNTCPSGQCFQDVPPGNPFFSYANTIFMQGIVTGYGCGGPGEPCIPPYNLPYYRPVVDVTRQQMAKFTNLARTMGGIDILSNSKTIPLRSESTAPLAVGIEGVASNSGPRNTDQVATGVWGRGTADTDYPNTGDVGLLGTAVDDNGVWANTENPTAWYALQAVNGGVYIGNELDPNSNFDDLFVEGHVTIQGGCTGCAATTVFRNTGASDLHVGDVVAVTSADAGPAQIGAASTAGAEAVSGAYSTGVVGVVTQLWVPGDPNGATQKSRVGHADHSAMTVKPGEYMVVVTGGQAASVKVDASNGPIHVGDLLVSGNIAGTAIKATDKVSSIGAVIGKALGNVESGTGTISVLVTLK